MNNFTILGKATMITRKAKLQYNIFFKYGHNTIEVNEMLRIDIKEGSSLSIVKELKGYKFNIEDSYKNGDKTTYYIMPIGRDIKSVKGLIKFLKANNKNLTSENLNECHISDLLSVDDINVIKEYANNKIDLGYRTLDILKVKTGDFTNLESEEIPFYILFDYISLYIDDINAPSLTTYINVVKKHHKELYNEYWK